MENAIQHLAEAAGQIRLARLQNHETNEAVRYFATALKLKPGLEPAHRALESFSTGSDH
jgi:hypothetical protein